MFRNLSAELVRHGIKVKDLAEYIGVSPKTASNKLNGKSEFTLSEINKISSLFPTMEVAYLFATDGESA